MRIAGVLLLLAACGGDDGEGSVHELVQCDVGWQALYPNVSLTGMCETGCRAAPATPNTATCTIKLDVPKNGTAECRDANGTVVLDGDKRGCCQPVIGGGDVVYTACE